MAPTIISTVVAPAAALFAGGQAVDLAGLATLKDDLGITQSGDDAFLRRAITRASQKATTYCNRTFQAQTIQDQIWALRDPFPWQLPSGFFPVQLSAWPLASPPSPAATAPPLAPALSQSSAGGLAAQRYYVKISYVTPNGETAASQESTLAVSANSVLNVASPIADTGQIATGWNVYVGTSSFKETLQNATPIAIGTPWAEPTGGLIAGAALPPYVLVVENAPLAPAPLAEGIDFDADAARAWLTRLFPMDASPRKWSSLPILVQYQAGYTASTLPADITEAVTTMVKQTWFARSRDPMLKQENVAGAYEASYWISAFMDRGAMPPEVTSLLDAYRVPVFG